MGHQIVGTDLDLTEQTRQEILEKIGKLDKFLTHLPDDTFYIRVAVNKDQRNPHWADALVDLALPGNKLMGRGKASTPVHAVHLAVRDLERQLNEYKQRRRPYI